MLDKHTLRANALAAAEAARACEWARVILNHQVVRAEQGGQEAPADLKASVEILKLQVEDELSKCYEALTGYYARPNQ